MTKGVPAYAGLIAAPTVSCLAVGALLGFPLHGALLGLGVGAGLSAAWRLAQVELVRDLRPVILAPGGAFGAVLVTLSFGALYPPQLASAAVLGCGAGLAAPVFMLIRGKGPPWRVAPAALAAAVIVFLFHALSLMPLVTSMTLGFAAAAAVLGLGIELPAFFIRPGRRWVSLALSAATGAGVGIVFGLAGQWWFHFGELLGWRALGNAWLTTVIAGAVIGAGFAFLMRLSEIVAPALRRRWQIAAFFVGVSVAFGIMISLLAWEVGIFSFIEDSRIDETLLVVILVAAPLVPVYLVRRRTERLARRAGLALALWFSVGLVWAGPWPHAALGSVDGTAASSLVAMISWKNSLADAGSSRAQLVHFTSEPPRFRSIRWPRVFTTPENASLLKDFRCVKLTLHPRGEIEKRLGVRSPCVVILTPDGREIDRFTGG